MASIKYFTMLLLLAFTGLLVTFTVGIPVEGRFPIEDIIPSPNLAYRLGEAGDLPVNKSGKLDPHLPFLTITSIPIATSNVNRRAEDVFQQNWSFLHHSHPVIPIDTASINYNKREEPYTMLPKLTNRSPIRPGEKRSEGPVTETPIANPELSILATSSKPSSYCTNESKFVSTSEAALPSHFTQSFKHFGTITTVISKFDDEKTILTYNWDPESDSSHFPKQRETATIVQTLTNGKQTTLTYHYEPATTVITNSEGEKTTMTYHHEPKSAWSSHTPTSILSSAPLSIARPPPKRADPDIHWLPLAAANAKAKCTTTKFVNRPFTFGPTFTQYAETTTHTSYVACEGCALEIVNRWGIGPEVHHTTTVTAKETKTVDVVSCSSSPGR